jgi:hypothetical protein
MLEPLVLHVEPIALPVDVPAGGSVDIEVELIALARSPRSGGGHQLFVKDAVVREQKAAAVFTDSSIEATTEARHDG